jgi:arginyl-tRNA synthetase
MDVELALGSVAVHVAILPPWTTGKPLPARAVKRLEDELERLAGAPVTLERPSRTEHGDYASNVALQLGPKNGRPPRELAERLAAEAAQLPQVERAEVAGPGFLNVFLTREWYGEALRELLEDGASYGGEFVETKERVQVELVSANPTGPLTVGSARNAAYGDSVARLLEFAGDEVER